ncbi:MAG: leucyl/phenylalanyl-tRNA--protein transferase [Gammaproteobacteria bacterium]|nr:leucyl/phenylalanyl-tRNA--protein transferase [Gammaproteobacteria bacterium]MCP5299788.1 leucyl/phenylalanyl-tRNA--protein transferase [Chromatiaceae bacterium]
MIFDLDGTPADIGFPDTRFAETEPNGLLAIGGDLGRTRLLNAYRLGIFPWFSRGQPILWWSPTPRMVLFPDEFRASRSLRKSLRNRGYRVSVDQAFEQVILGCAGPRRGDPGTWLLPQMVAAYRALHEDGHAHSIEVWREEELVGGLYGIALGQTFFGESMFSRRTDASKVALALLVRLARRQPYRLIDCQVYTEHLASLGAREIERAAFEHMLRDHVAAPAAALAPQPPFHAQDLLA